jgi:hypothetical protein
MLLGELAAREATATDVSASCDRAKRAIRTWKERTTTIRVAASPRGPKAPSFDDRTSKRSMGVRRTVLRVLPATKAP